MNTYTITWTRTCYQTGTFEVQAADGSTAEEMSSELIAEKVANGDYDEDTDDLSVDSTEMKN